MSGLFDAEGLRSMLSGGGRCRSESPPPREPGPGARNEALSMVEDNGPSL